MRSGRRSVICCSHQSLERHQERRETVLLAVALRSGKQNCDDLLLASVLSSVTRSTATVLAVALRELGHREERQAEL
jgi:hypothetical protein